MSDFPIPVRAKFEPGAVVRSDREVVAARVYVHQSGRCSFVDASAGGTVGSFQRGHEGVHWARGEWESEAVVALRALVALDRSR